VERNVAVVALMEGEHPEEVSWRFCSSRGAFAGPKQGGEVIRFVANGAFADVETMGGGLVLEDSPGQFEVRVGERTGVVGSGQLLLQVDRERKAPNDRRWSGAGGSERRPNRGGAEYSVRLGQEDATSAWLGGIMGAMQRWLNRDKFGNARGAGRKVKVYLSEIGQDELELGGKADAAGAGVGAEGFLKETE
jgi:hypothetical protein